MGAPAEMLPPPEPSHRELLLAARAGDESSLEAFCRARFSWMRRIALLELGDTVRADDAVQDAMIQLVGNIGRWDPSRPFEPWLATIVRNAARQHRRRWRPWEPLVERLRPSRLDHDLDLGRAAGAALEAFDALSPGQRQAAYHVDVLDMDVDEVARMFGIAPSTVRVQLHRARKSLRENLQAWHALLEES